MTAQEKRINRFVKHISKVIVKHIEDDEDMANQTAYDLNRKSQNPEHLDDFLEAWGIVEHKIRKALGVKRSRK